MVYKMILTMIILWTVLFWVEPQLVFAKSLSIPSFSAEIGSVITVQINIDDASGISAFGMVLNFGSKALDFVRVASTSLTSDFDYLDANQKSPGKITIGGIRINSPIQEGNGPFVEVTFNIKEDADGTHIFFLSDLVDDIKGARVSSGTLTITGGEESENIEDESDVQEEFPSETVQEIAISETQSVTSGNVFTGGKKSIAALPESSKDTEPYLKSSPQDKTIIPRKIGNKSNLKESHSVSGEDTVDSVTETAMKKDVEEESSGTSSNIKRSKGTFRAGKENVTKPPEYHDRDTNFPWGNLVFSVLLIISFGSASYWFIKTTSANRK